MYILTADIGTTSVKAALIDEKGRVKRTGHMPLETYYPYPGWAEQEFLQYIYNGLINAVRDAMEGTSPKAVAALALSGTMNGLLALGGRGEPLTHNIIHADTRADEQCLAIEKEIGREAFFARTGNRIDAHMSLPKAAWMRDNWPDVHARTRWYVCTKDWVRGVLTGELGLTDPSDASLTTAYDLTKRQWDEPIARAGGMWGKLPDVLPSSDTHLKLNAYGAELLGLLEGTPVAVGAGDGACATLGAGIASRGEGYMCLGSSGWSACLTGGIAPDDRCFHYIDATGEHITFTGTVQCVTAALDYMLFTVLGFPPGAEGFRQAEAQAAASPPGARGLLFAPTLMGERTPVWDAGTRGALINLSLSHTRADITRACYEGVAHALSEALRIQRENGAAPASIALVGGGARSALWPKMLSSMCGVPVRVAASPGEATALGAAFAAGVGIGMWKGFPDAARLARFGEAIPPDGEESGAYRAAHERHREIYESVKGLRPE